jgi:hypothetical protein
MGLGMPKLLRTAILQSVSTGQNSSCITLFMQRSIEGTGGAVRTSRLRPKTQQEHLNRYMIVT